MKNFLLDQKPNFGEAKLSLNGIDYKLVRVKGNGCYLQVSQDGVEKDHVIFSQQDLKALFLMLCVE